MKIVTGLWGSWSFRWKNIYPTKAEVTELLDSEGAWIRIFRKDVEIAHIPVSHIPLIDFMPKPYVLPQSLPLEETRYEAPLWFRLHLVVEER